jgi:hypothetical protein
MLGELTLVNHFAHRVQKPVKSHPSEARDCLTLSCRDRGGVRVGDAISEHETAQTVVGGRVSEGSFVALVWFVGRERMRRPQVVVVGAMVVGAWIVGLNLATVAQADGFGVAASRTTTRSSQ